MTKLIKTLRIKRKGQDDLVLSKGMEVTSSVVGKKQVLAFIEEGSIKQVITAAPKKKKKKGAASRMMAALNDVAATIQNQHSSSYSKKKEKAILNAGAAFQKLINKHGDDFNTIDLLNIEIQGDISKVTQILYKISDESEKGDPKSDEGKLIAKVGNAVLLKALHAVAPRKGGLYPNKFLPFVASAARLFEAVTALESKGDAKIAKSLINRAAKDLRGITILPKPLMKWATS